MVAVRRQVMLRRKLGLERCLRCGWRKVHWWLGRQLIDASHCTTDICTYDTWHGLQ